MNIRISVFARLCKRCREIMMEAGAPQVFVDIYQSASGQPLQQYSDLTKEVKRARSRANRATKAKDRALGEMDSLFLSARAAVVAVDPGRELPATLKRAPTDTDKREAVEELVEALADHAGEAWADNMAQGAFGQKAPATIQAIDDYIAALNALQKAKAARKAAFASAWEAFLAYKGLVRSTLGAASRQYQRLRLRNAASDDEEDAEEDGEEGEGEGGEEEVPAPASEPTPPAQEPAPVAQ